MECFIVATSKTYNGICPAYRFSNATKEQIENAVEHLKSNLSKEHKWIISIDIQEKYEGIEEECNTEEIATENIVGKRIKKALRTNTDMTQKELAKKIGVPPSSINKWIKGERVPRKDNMEKLAQALGVRVDYLRAEAEKALEEMEK